MYDHQITMDWFFWLSKTGLDRSLIYEYGLVFTRNEVEGEDLKFFNHEFLQSMGISVAKHRLEILKLARKEIGESPFRVLRLFFTINKAKNRFAKSIGKWAFPRESTHIPGPAINTPYRDQWAGSVRRQYSSREFTSWSPSVSGRHDGKLLSPSVSGRFDGRVRRSFSFSSKSPNISWPTDSRASTPKVKIVGGKGVGPLWSLMFQDMKPT